MMGRDVRPPKAAFSFLLFINLKKDIYTIRGKALR
jgi:hypothetical protein